MRSIFTMNKIFCLSFFASLIYTIATAPKLDSTDQLEITELVTVVPEPNHQTVKVIEEKILISKVKTNESDDANALTDSFSIKVYRILTDPIIRIIRTPKVNAVLRNIGTCLVNGAMELFSYYLPPPVMPLLASAAGFVIPFEPVVMLKEKMPVNTYRRAFKTAMNTFLNTFDQFKTEDDIDPYMTRRFNRRFLDEPTNNTLNNT